jgi:putative N6-adenine-specific DNA methylase
MYQYQKSGRYFAQIADGAEQLGGQELEELGAEEIQPMYRGIYFCADRVKLYRINYTARLITRILAPLITFDCHSTKYLQKTARSIRWEDFLHLPQTFAISANVSNSKIRHSQYAALCLKDVIVDNFRRDYGQRPDIDTINPDLWINLHIRNNRATISIDTSGGSLHRRGYRVETVEAPMQETVAAAIIRLTRWDGSTKLYDPMCGSGTLVAEALMACCRVPAGHLRKRFGFENLPDYDSDLWQSVKTNADSLIRGLPDGLISGGDLSEQAVSAAKMNLARLPSGERVSLERADFRDIRELKNAVIVSNPPYGLRLKGQRDPGAIYKSLGDFLKQRCQGSTAYIYFGNREMIGTVGLRPSWKKPLANGGLDGRVVKFEIY